MRRPELTIKQILAWADAYHERTGMWPEKSSGLVWEVPDEKWMNIDCALRLGLRGLHRGRSLANLLDKRRGKRNRKQLPKYTIRQILVWADAHRARTGNWPRRTDGPIPGTRGETWLAVEIAMSHGQRGMPGGSSLAKLLAAKRGVRRRIRTPRLTVPQILRWADLHRVQTGHWPTRDSDLVPSSETLTWRAIDNALREGRRGHRRSSIVHLQIAGQAPQA